jgi:hypothetical protein
VLKRRTHARAHALVGWLSGRLDSSVRPCGRARGVAGVGVVYHENLDNQPWRVTSSAVYPYDPRITGKQTVGIGPGNTTQVKPTKQTCISKHSWGFL